MRIGSGPSWPGIFLSTTRWTCSGVPPAALIRNVQVDLLRDLLKWEVLVGEVRGAADVGAVDLQDQTGIDDCLVFVAHRVGERVEVST